jgi:hypothetical protein
MFRRHLPQGGDHVPNPDRVVRAGRGHRQQVRRQGNEVYPQARVGLLIVLQLLAVLGPENCGGRLIARIQIPPSEADADEIVALLRFPGPQLLKVRPPQYEWGRGWAGGS